MQSASHSLTESYDAQPGAVAHARARMAQFAAAGGAAAEKVNAVRLAVSEAVTNAVVHGYPERPGQVQVTAALASGELWILVSDDGVGMHSDSERTGLGLGLGIISRTSDHLAIVPRSSGGTEVRMRFDLVAAHAPTVRGAHMPGERRRHRGLGRGLAMVASPSRT